MRGKLGAFLLGPSLAAAYVLGCATARYVEPPARARANGPRWQYVCVSPHPSRPLDDQLNALGDAGWELAAADAGDPPTWCLKRAY